jgi:predicted CXXCH cytochrome family protein
MRWATRTLVVAAMIAGIVLFAGVNGALGEHKDVAGSKHDVATIGTPACVYCHVPRDAAGQLLWPGAEPNPDGALAGQKRLCFSCHDGTVTAERSYVFDPGRPEHIRKPGVDGQDCDRCHNAHEARNNKFLKMSNQANFCWNCHFRAGPADHPVGIDASAAGIHPPDTTFDPKSGDFSGIRLWNAEGTGPGKYVMCLSCHATHGGQPESNILTGLAAPHENSFQALCRSCHVQDGGR